MKVLLTVVVMALAFGVAGLQSADARWGEGGYGGGPGDCDGSCYGQENDERSEAWQKFRDDTEDLRGKLFDLRNEYAELMAQENPDKDEANRLWSEKFDLRNQLQKKAAESGFGPGSGSGRGYGRGSGGCNGPRWQ